MSEQPNEAITWALHLALSNYVEQSCVYCGHVYDSVEDIIKREAVRANEPPANITLACKACYDEAHNANT